MNCFGYALVVYTYIYSLLQLELPNTCPSTLHSNFV